ncbi:MAG TPA: hypothetical protein VJN18_06855 [Polyangiaceae bacterium]|nr:hypothetical protein [Polyangiaceae bacterium]
MRLVAVAASVALGLTPLTTAGRARAFERQWHLGGGAGVSGGSGLSLSPAFGLYAAYGLSDVFDARLEVTARGYHLGSEQDPNALSAMVGLTYKLDVLSWVPWAGVYAGYQGFDQAPREGLPFEQHAAALGMGLGLDYGWSRSFGLGITLRSDDALSDAGAASFDALLRAEYRWGW